MLCKICNQREADSKNICKVCSYKQRHLDDVNKIIRDGFWMEEEIDLILDKILYRDINVINDLLLFLHNKNLSDLVELLRGDLRIGNAPQLVEMNCFTCGAPVKRTLARFYDERVYCSFKCRDEYKSLYLSGENSPFYNRKHTVCTNCEKPIDIIPYNYNKVNEFGDNNHFCSQECYWEYRSKYYVGERHPLFGVERPEEVKEKSRETIIQNIINGKIPQTLTKPHVKIHNLLLENNIDCVDEYPCKYYSIDIYVEKFNLMIEIMGDYWHGNPLKYTYDELNKYQLKDIRQDKSKHTYIQRYYNREILYLWESDINKNIELCWNLILLFIKNDGYLDNYHSFNYYMDNNTILMHDNIVLPYFYNTESLTTAG